MFSGLTNLDQCCCFSILFSSSVLWAEVSYILRSFCWLRLYDVQVIVEKAERSDIPNIDKKK